MTLFPDARLYALAFLVVGLLAFGNVAEAVLVNSAADGVQLKEGCTGGTADFCDLRIYQVMVEAFVDGDSNHDYNDGYGTSHHKGDLRGIINSLPYIKDQGMNAIWMTPIFDSDAGGNYENGHYVVGSGPRLKLDATGYYARDYFSIDPKFGTLDDARELVDTAHSMGMYVLFDGVFGHHKGNLVPSPTGKLPVNYSPGLVDYNYQASVDFYSEVATYWIDELGIDGWRMDQSYQVPPNAWRSIKADVDALVAQRKLDGEEWGTLGYIVAEDWNNSPTIANQTYGTNANPILDSAFDFMVRYATVGVLASEANPAMSGRPASVLAENWSYGAHDHTFRDLALPNLMLGNHDLVRLGDLLQRGDIAEPTDAEYWTRHKLMFMVQSAFTGPITRYYGEEIGDEVPGFDDAVGGGCVFLGLCDDHVARTSAKILDVTVTSAQLSAEQHDLMDFHRNLMAVREQYPALSHGSRQHLYSDTNLYVDLKTFDDEEIVFAMNVSDSPINVELNMNMFDSTPNSAWDLLEENSVSIVNGLLTFTLQPLSGHYFLLAESPGLSGDFDGNGMVDSADFLLWQQDPSIGNLADWEANYGQSFSASATTVPEPGSAVLLSLMTILFSSRIVSRRN